MGNSSMRGIFLVFVMLIMLGTGCTTTRYYSYDDDIVEDTTTDNDVYEDNTDNDNKDDSADNDVDEDNTGDDNKDDGADNGEDEDNTGDDNKDDGADNDVDEDNTDNDNKDDGADNDVDEDNSDNDNKDDGADNNVDEDNTDDDNKDEDTDDGRIHIQSNVDISGIWRMSTFIDTYEYIVELNIDTDSLTYEWSLIYNEMYIPYSEGTLDKITGSFDVTNIDSLDKLNGYDTIYKFTQNETNDIVFHLMKIVDNSLYMMDIEFDEMDSIVIKDIVGVYTKMTP